MEELGKVLQEQQDHQHVQTPLLWHLYPAGQGVCRCLQVLQNQNRTEKNHPAIINSNMKLAEITQPRIESASADLCKSSKSDEELGASNLASCKSQGLRGRKSKVKHTIKGKRQSIDGERIKGKKYGGPLPDWS